MLTKHRVSVSYSYTVWLWALSARPGGKAWALPWRSSHTIYSCPAWPSPWMACSGAGNAVPGLMCCGQAVAERTRRRVTKTRGRPVLPAHFTAFVGTKVLGKKSSTLCYMLIWSPLPGNYEVEKRVEQGESRTCVWVPISLWPAGAQIASQNRGWWQCRRGQSEEMTQATCKVIAELIQNLKCFPSPLQRLFLSLVRLEPCRERVGKQRT